MQEKYAWTKQIIVYLHIIPIVHSKEVANEQFDNVWMGKFCKDCGRRDYCADPIK